MWWPRPQQPPRRTNWSTGRSGWAAHHRLSQCHGKNGSGFYPLGLCHRKPWGLGECWRRGPHGGSVRLGPWPSRCRQQRTGQAVLKHKRGDLWRPNHGYHTVRSEDQDEQCWNTREQPCIPLTIFRLNSKLDQNLKNCGLICPLQIKKMPKIQMFARNSTHDTPSEVAW